MLWIVGKWIPGGQWEFMGVFDTAEKVIDACTTSDFFTAPAVLNMRCPDEGQDWKGAFYPRAWPYKAA